MLTKCHSSSDAKSKELSLPNSEKDDKATRLLCFLDNSLHIFKKI